MELKFYIEIDGFISRNRFNRTFMELKWITRNKTETLIRVLIVPLWNWNTVVINIRWRIWPVLIVPLWNWNKGDKAKESESTFGFNRTFMELK